MSLASEIATAIAMGSGVSRPVSVHRLAEANVKLQHENEAFRVLLIRYKYQLDLQRHENMQILKQQNLASNLHDTECVVCMLNPVQVAVVPCGHCCLCSECAARIKPFQCPMCRQEGHYIKTYWSMPEKTLFVRTLPCRI